MSFWSVAKNNFWMNGGKESHAVFFKIPHNSNKIMHNSNKIMHNSSKILHNSNKILHNSNKIMHNSNKIMHNSNKILTIQTKSWQFKQNSKTFFRLHNAFAFKNSRIFTRWSKSIWIKWGPLYKSANGWASFAQTWNWAENRKWGVDPRFWSGGPSSFDPRGALSPKFAPNIQGFFL